MFFLDKRKDGSEKTVPFTRKLLTLRLVHPPKNEFANLIIIKVFLTFIF